MFNRIKDYAMGLGNTPLTQNIVDYGTAAALGATGQQVMNMATPGADPNPLLSGALYAPMGVSGLRRARAFRDPSALMDNPNLLAPRNAIEQAALTGSIAGATGGGLTSAYNTLTGGADIDNNLPAGILAATAPITAYLLSKRKGSQPVA